MRKAEALLSVEERAWNPSSQVGRKTAYDFEANQGYLVLRRTRVPHCILTMFLSSSLEKLPAVISGSVLFPFLTSEEARYLR